MRHRVKHRQCMDIQPFILWLNLISYFICNLILFSFMTDLYIIFPMLLHSFDSMCILCQTILCFYHKNIYFIECSRFWSFWNTFEMACFVQVRVCSIGVNMMTSSNGNIFGVTGPLCGEFTGPRWIPRTKAGDAGLGCFLWSAPE